MSTATVELQRLAGTDLGTHTSTYDDTATILYALAVGASATELDLVYERDLRAMPTYACAMGLWAVEAAGRLGAYDPRRSLHAGQRLVIHRPLPASGSIPMTGRVANVYDKGKAAVVEIEVSSEVFSTVYTIFLPGLGGWGGDRGPAADRGEPVPPTTWTTFATSPNLAALYRLTGDRHPVHIDPDVATANGFDRPILHGLCTLGITARIVAGQVGAHPAGLEWLDARLAAPVLPGDTLEIGSGTRDGLAYLTARSGDMTVLTGRARYCV
ncbi:N-terminal half of MaoC dehydratase [Pseudonocardia thermophila]|jgi:Acyl dehydratase|uniref:N-terminal half of MaoC dehydratase n=1 Tax=Pseudonocardia thermophila TaxID=1848 RepID=A0A1M6S0X2_PSETH|nr:MaoC/PaaZ C-terminal domain-containing protein [Pseudonocardia thermophila]SHK38462.1 N-terminal half of MaoC dehydratase [Pseudonocardia thermophila]